MPQAILKPLDVAKRLRAGETREQIFLDGNGGVKAKLIGPRATVRAVGDDDSRTIDFVISTEAIDRYDSTIALGGWVLANYRRNPVVLWGHDDYTPPIGRGNVRTEGNSLCSTVEFAPPDIYPLAETIYQLTKRKFINAASVGFMPLDYEYSNDDERPYGIDFVKQELLEWSVVSIPANADCLAQARSAGVDCGPLIPWAERLLDRGGFSTLPRAELEALRRAAGAPALVGVRWNRGTFVRDAGDDEAAADWKCGAARDLPINHDDSWDGSAAEAAIFSACGFDGDSPDTAKARKCFLFYDAAAPQKRGSYKDPFVKIVDGALQASKSGLNAAASRLSGTDVPQAAKDAAQKVLDAYKSKMDDDAGADGDGDGKNDKAKTDVLRAAIRAALLFVIKGRSVDDAVDVIMHLVAEQARAGRVLSAENEEALRAALEHCQTARDRCDKAMEHLRGVIEKAKKPDDDAGDDDATGDPDDGTNDDPEQAAATVAAQRQRASFLKIKGGAAA